MAPRLKDIAEECGVSTSTVSYILNGARLERYTPELCKRVRSAAVRLRYQPNRTAQSMRSQTSRIIGFIASNYRESEGQLHNYGTTAFQVGLSRYLVSRGYHMAQVEIGEIEPAAGPDALAADAYPAYSAAPAALRERFFDGLVINQGLSDFTSEAIEAFSEQFQYPVIWWDVNRIRPTNTIYRDETEVGRAVTARLIELGHRNIGYLWPPANWESYLRGRGHYSSLQRYDGYLAALRAAGLSAYPIVGLEPEFIAGYVESNEITAAIDQDIYVLLATNRLGLRVPEQFSIATCDFEERVPDLGFSRGGMSYDRYAAGEIAGKLLIDLIQSASNSVPSVCVLGKYRDGDTIASCSTLHPF